MDTDYITRLSALADRVGTHKRLMRQRLATLRPDAGRERLIKRIGQLTFLWHRLRRAYRRQRIGVPV